MVHDQFRRWFLPGAVLVVALVIVGGDLAAWWFFGWPDVFATLVMNGAVAIGTLTLAVVAWIENQNTVRQMEIDRAKPGVLTLIAYWLDGLYTALDGDRDRFTEQDGDDPIAFHQFGPITDPFLEAPIDDNELPDRIVQEISEAYPSLPNHIERYDQTAAEYRERRNDVKQALEEYFQHEFVDYLEPEQVQTEIQQYLNDEGMGDYTPEEYLANRLLPNLAKQLFGM